MFTGWLILHALSQFIKATVLGSYMGLRCRQATKEGRKETDMSVMFKKMIISTVFCNDPKADYFTVTPLPECVALLKQHQIGLFIFLP